MKDKFIITIDGPAGAGKTTIAKTVSEKLGFRYVDTGAMFRAVTLSVIEHTIGFSHITEIERLAGNIDLRIDFSGSKMLIFINGREVSNEIRCPAVTDNTSAVSAIPAVRNRLSELQRSAAETFGRVVFEGRDTGSAVFPDADLKVYLDAGIEERARRRWQELKARGLETEIETLKASIEKRDALDRSRGLDPLRVPENAYIIDSTDMSIEEVADRIVSRVRNKY